MRLGGLRDIKTQGSLAREGRLISVARNLHRLRSRESKSGAVTDDWSLERHVYSKQRPVRPRSVSVASLHRELFLENKARLHQIEVIRDFLQEARKP